MDANHLNLAIGLSAGLGVLLCLYIVLVIVYIRQRRRNARQQLSDDASELNNTVLEKVQNQRKYRVCQVLQQLKSRTARSCRILVRNPFQRKNNAQPDVSWTVRPRTPVSVYSTRDDVDVDNWPLPSQTLPPYQTPNQRLPSYRSPSPAPDAQALRVLRNLGYSSYINIRGLYGLGLDIENSQSGTVHDMSSTYASSTPTTPRSSIYERSVTPASTPRSSYQSDVSQRLSKWTATASGDEVTTIITTTNRASSNYSSHLENQETHESTESFLVESPTSTSQPPLSPGTSMRGRSFTQRSLNRYIIAHPSPSYTTPLPTPIDIDLPAPLKPAKLKLRNDLSPSMSVRFSQWI